jgi:hypothetical protein
LEVSQNFSHGNSVWIPHLAHPSCVPSTAQPPRLHCTNSTRWPVQTTKFLVMYYSFVTLHNNLKTAFRFPCWQKYSHIFFAWKGNYKIKQNTITHFANQHATRQRKRYDLQLP